MSGPPSPWLTLVTMWQMFKRHLSDFPQNTADAVKRPNDTPAGWQENQNFSHLLDNCGSNWELTHQGFKSRAHEHSRSNRKGELQLINYSINGMPFPPEISSNHLISHVVWGQRCCATCKKHEPLKIKRFEGNACHIRFSVCRARLNVTRFNRSDSHLRITPIRKHHSSVMPWLYGALNITTRRGNTANLLLCEMKWAINAFNFLHFSGWKWHNKRLLWGPTFIKKPIGVCVFIVAKASITIFDFKNEIWGRHIVL